MRIIIGVLGGFAVAMILAIATIYILIARDLPSPDRQGLGDMMLAAFLVSRPINVPQACIPPAFETGTENYRRFVEEQSQTSLFLCLRPVVRKCDGIDILQECTVLLWPKEIREISGLTEYLVILHKNPCLYRFEPAGAHYTRWKDTGYFPQTGIESDKPPLLETEKPGCSKSLYTLEMKVRS